MSKKTYRLISLNTISKYEDKMKDLGVSKVARGPGGFLPAYKRAKGKRSDLPDRWINKRRGFIARHLAQYKKNPTKRRKLALIAWAYMPKD